MNNYLKGFNNVDDSIPISDLPESCFKIKVSHI